MAIRVNVKNILLMFLMILLLGSCNFNNSQSISEGKWVGDYLTIEIHGFSESDYAIIKSGGEDIKYTFNYGYGNDFVITKRRITSSGDSVTGDGEKYRYFAGRYKIKKDKLYLYPDEAGQQIMGAETIVLERIAETSA